MQKLCNCGNATQSQCRLDSAMNTLLRRTARACVYIHNNGDSLSTAKGLDEERPRRACSSARRRRRRRRRGCSLVGCFISRILETRKRPSHSSQRQFKVRFAYLFNDELATTAWKASRVCSFHARIMCSRGLMGGSFAICITSVEIHGPRIDQILRGEEIRRALSPIVPLIRSL